MTTIIDLPIITCLIKGNAVNGKNARICIQRHDLAIYGFDCGERYSLSFEEDSIVLTARPDGERKVSRVVDKRRDKVYQTIDLRFPEDIRRLLFLGHKRLQVTVKFKQITINQFFGE